MQQANATGKKYIFMEEDMMAYSTTNLTRRAASQLFYGGLVIQDISGFHNLTALDTCLKVLEVFEGNETRINETFGPYLSCDGFPISPINVLKSLAMLIEELPHDTTANHDLGFYAGTSVLALIVLLTRLYVRRFKAPKVLHTEDWLASASMIFVILCAVFLQLTPSTHVYDFSWDALKMWGITIYTAYQMFFVSHILIKFSFLAFYYRLNPERAYRRSVIIVAVLVTMFSMSAWLTTTLQCIPANSVWLHPFKVRTCIPDKKCINRVVAFIVAGGFIIISDLLILLLPIPMVWNMVNLHKREKVAISCMFLAGLFITTFSILRVRTLKPWLTSNDFPSKVSGQEVFMIMELNISVIISCLPALKPILFPKRKPSSVILSFLTNFAANNFGARPRVRKSGPYGLNTTINTSQTNIGRTGDFHQTAATSATVASVGTMGRRGKEGDRIFSTIHSIGPKDEHKDYRNHDPWLWDPKAKEIPEPLTETIEETESGESAGTQRDREVSHGTVDTIEPLQEPTQLQAPSAAHIRQPSTRRVTYADIKPKKSDEDVKVKKSNENIKEERSDEDFNKKKSDGDMV